MRKRVFNDDDREEADKTVCEILEWMEDFGKSYGTGTQRREFLQDIVLKYMKKK